MPFLVYIRDVLQPSGVSPKVVYDEEGGAPVLGEADRRAGILDWHEVKAADAGHPLDLLCRLYPRRPAATARAA